MTAYDSGGALIGSADGSIDVLGPDEESIAVFYFNSVSDIASVKYDLSYSTDTHYSPVLSDLQQEISVNDNNVVLSITNNGTKPAEFVEAYALFTDTNGNIVSYNQIYFTDDDMEIKPGDTITNQFNSYEDFENVSCYLTGRR